MLLMYPGKERAIEILVAKERLHLSETGRRIGDSSSRRLLFVDGASAPTNSVGSKSSEMRRLEDVFECEEWSESDANGAETSASERRRLEDSFESEE